MVFHAIRRHPFKASLCITTAKTVTADFFVQRVVERRDTWDTRRTLVFGIFGFGFQGGIQYGIVNHVFEPLFPGRAPARVAAKILGMNLMSDPFVFLPTFYLVKEGLQREELSWRMASSAMDKYRDNIIVDCCNSWMIWFPGHIVTYGLMPPAFRLPWMSLVSFGYVCLLSVTRGKLEEREESRATVRRYRSSGLVVDSASTD